MNVLKVQNSKNITSIFHAFDLKKDIITLDQNTLFSVEFSTSSEKIALQAYKSASPFNHIIS